MCFVGRPMFPDVSVPRTENVCCPFETPLFCHCPSYPRPQFSYLAPSSEHWKIVNSVEDQVKRGDVSAVSITTNERGPSSKLFPVHEDRVPSPQSKNARKSKEHWNFTYSLAIHSVVGLEELRAGGDVIVIIGAVLSEVKMRKSLY